MRTDISTTASPNPESLRLIAVRALAFVAAMMLIHSVLMLDPAGAHAEAAEATVQPQASMTMAAWSSAHPATAMVAERPAQGEHQPPPGPGERDCGVVLPGVMSGTSTSVPIALGPPPAALPATPSDQPTIAASTDQDRPSQDPRRKRALLQIWRV